MVSRRGKSGELVFNDTEFQFEKMKKVMEMDGGGGCISVNAFNTTELCA